MQSFAFSPNSNLTNENQLEILENWICGHLGFTSQNIVNDNNQFGIERFLADNCPRRNTSFFPYVNPSYKQMRNDIQNLSNPINFEGCVYWTFMIQNQRYYLVLKF